MNNEKPVLNFLACSENYKFERQRSFLTLWNKQFLQTFIKIQY